MKRIAVAVLSSFLALFALPANALLIEVDLVAGSGDGLLIRDTVNNREWVDVTATTNMSANSALGIYQPLGFGIATSNDVIQLFVAAGIPDILVGGPPNLPSDPGTGGTVANRVPVEQLLALMEHAPPYSDTGGNPWVHGYTDFGSATNLTLSRFAAFTHDNIGRANVNSNGTGWNYNSVNSAVGTYLVRDTSAIEVSEPGAILIIGLGLVGLGFARHNRMM